jgi:hypothetical protein
MGLNMLSTSPLRRHLCRSQPYAGRGCTTAGGARNKRQADTPPAPARRTTSPSSFFLLPWVCGDQLLSSLHNFKYHLLECSNPGMASTAGGVQCREEKARAYIGLVGLMPGPVAHSSSYRVLNRRITLSWSSSPFY